MNESQELQNLIFKAYNQMESAYERLKIEGKTAFLGSVSEHFVGLAKEQGQEEVLRNLAQLRALNYGKDDSIVEKATSILQETLGSMEIDPELLEECPVCDQRTVRFFACGNCGFSFAEDYVCPYLNQDERRCHKNKQECKLFGTEFEECATYNGD